MDEARPPISVHALGAASAVGLYAAAISLSPSSAWALALSAIPIAVIVVWWTIQTPGRWLGLFFASALLLPPLNLPLGNSGPHPALVAAILGVFIGVLRVREWATRWDPLSLSLVIFLAVLLASVPLAAAYSGINIAFGSLARVILFGISVYVFFFVTHGPMRLEPRRTWLGIRLLLWAAAASAAFACIDFYYQFPAPAGFGPQFIWLDSGVYRRAQGFFYEASTLGNFCAFFLVMIAVALFRPREGRPASRAELLGCGTLLSTALVLSYSRGSLINVAVALLVLMVLQKHRFNAKALIKGLAILLTGGFAALYLLFPSFAQSYWTRLLATMEYFYSSPNGVLSGRIQSWERLARFLVDWIQDASLFGCGCAGNHRRQHVLQFADRDRDRGAGGICLHERQSAQSILHRCT
jgi:hypothetical protein